MNDNPIPNATQKAHINLLRKWAGRMEKKFGPVVFGYKRAWNWQEALAVERYGQDVSEWPKAPSELDIQRAKAWEKALPGREGWPVWAMLEPPAVAQVPGIGPKEAYYNQYIRPLMDRVIAACENQGIPCFLHIVLDNGMCSTTALHGKEPKDWEQIKPLQDILGVMASGKPYQIVTR